ncbi:MAG: HYExAFE family protein [Planctomycetota bacterium]|nr:HYExAFE family protein [Planctomycetota bacterium]
MANRKVIYEACFEDYLRTAGVPYVAVDEAKKALFAGVRLKSFDFVVYSANGANLLVDVKGRRFPYERAGSRPSTDSGRSRAGPRGRRRLENWTTREDLESLAQWEEVFGSGFAGLLAFCYHLMRPEAAEAFEVVHLFRGEYYALMGVYRGAYADAARPRSRAWDTVSVPTRTFRELVRPIRAFF